MLKSEIRTEALKRRNEISNADKSLFDRLVFERAHKLKSFLLAKNVHIYKSKNEEVDTDSFFEYAWALNKTVYAPFTQLQNNQPGSVIVNRNTQWSAGKFGIKEPKVSSSYEVVWGLPNDTVVIVPIVAFSSNLFRVGYGMGFYDRLLENFTGVTIGLAFECQKVPSIQSEPHDRPMSVIATERHLYVQ
ncbi:MAG: 5-formyltetrahydrofolate cyclo-ligase [Ignavibacteria bacterium]|nr:5-formyltetrahydrofolate cyclo-ligase [Ignavibacteria bacterium]